MNLLNNNIIMKHTSLCIFSKFKSNPRMYVKFPSTYGSKRIKNTYACSPLDFNSLTSQCSPIRWLFYSTHQTTSSSGFEWTRHSFYCSARCFGRLPKRISLCSTLLLLHSVPDTVRTPRARSVATGPRKSTRTITCWKKCRPELGKLINFSYWTRVKLYTFLHNVGFIK